jgi:hypothetical protein
MLYKSEKTVSSSTLQKLCKGDHRNLKYKEEKQLPFLNSPLLSNPYLPPLKKIAKESVSDILTSSFERADTISPVAVKELFSSGRTKTVLLWSSTKSINPEIVESVIFSSLLQTPL